MKNLTITLLTAATISLSALSASADENILDLIREANLNDTLEQKYDRIAFRTSITAADGSIISEYSYLDEDGIVTESDGNVLIDTPDMVFGFDDNEKTPYIYIYLDDARDTVPHPVTGFTWDPAEIVIESYEEDGQLIVHTQGSSEDMLQNNALLATSLGYNVTDQFAILTEYIVDPQSYEILGGSEIVYPDGMNAYVFAESVRVDDPEEYVISQELLEAIFSEDSRTVTVIADPGTEYETVYSTVVGKGCSVAVFPSFVHPYLYADSECTQYYESTGDLNSDMIVYTTRRDSLLEESTVEEAAASENSSEAAIDADLVQCELCGGWFEAGNVFRNHICSGASENTAAEPEYVQCDVCGNWYEAGNVFRNHICSGTSENTAIEPEYVQCDVCGNWYEEGTVFRNHVCDGTVNDYNEVSYDEAEPQYVQCEICGDWFEEGNIFRNHECIAYPAE